MAPCPLLFMAPPSPQAPPFRTPAVDQTGIEERVARIKARSIKKETKVQGMKLALSMIDLTTLEGADTPSKVRQLCYKAMHLHDSCPACPPCGGLRVPHLGEGGEEGLGQ
jgi:deoxyribose-phosphate aldolase